MKALILAAGKGTRFDSSKAKVLHKVAGKTLVRHVVDLATSLGIKEKIVVVGYQAHDVRAILEDVEGIHFVWQKEQLGTGHAVMMAEPLLQGFTGEVLILYGDVPGIRKETLQKMIDKHRESGCTITVLTANLTDPKWYGRIVKDEKGQVVAIREAKDANPGELKIKEINSGILIVDNQFLFFALDQLHCQNGQCEYYLTDIVGIACKEGKKVCTLIAEDNKEICGVNSLEELQEMENIFQGGNS